MKFYTLDGQFIREGNGWDYNFTGFVVTMTGSKEWFVKDKLHRLNGPAIELKNGKKEYWIDDKRITNEQHDLFVSILKLKGLL